MSLPILRFHSLLSTFHRNLAGLPMRTFKITLYLVRQRTTDVPEQKYPHLWCSQPRLPLSTAEQSQLLTRSYQPDYGQHHQISLLDGLLVPEHCSDNPVRVTAPPGNSDHFTSTLRPKQETPMDFPKQLVLDTRSSHLDRFLHNLQCNSLDDLYGIEEIDAKVAHFYHSIHDAMRAIPTSYVTVRDSDPPWVSKVVLDILRKKLLYYRHST